MTGRLKEFGTLDRSEATEPLDAILGNEVTITDAEILTGNFGEFVRFVCTDTRGKTHTVSAGGFLVVDALKDAIEKGALPLAARFLKRGRTYIFE